MFRRIILELADILAGDLRQIKLFTIFLFLFTGSGFVFLIKAPNPHDMVDYEFALSAMQPLYWVLGFAYCAAMRIAILTLDVPILHKEPVTPLVAATLWTTLFSTSIMSQHSALFGFIYLAPAFIEVLIGARHFMRRKA